MESPRSTDPSHKFSIIVIGHAEDGGVIIGKIPTDAFKSDAESTALEKAEEWRVQIGALFETASSFVAPSVTKFLVAIVDDSEPLFDSSDPTYILQRMDELITAED